MASTGGVTAADRLAQGLGDLVGEIRRLREDYRADAKRQRRRNAMTLVAVVILILFTAGVGMVAYQNRQLSNKIADCTTEGGTCYEEGRRRSAEVLNQLNRANIAVHTCAATAGVDTDAEIEACVQRKLAAAVQR